MTPKLTDAGKSLLLKAMVGECINFTKIQFGNGPKQDVDKAVALINPLITSKITSITSGESYVTLTATFTNASLSDGFRITETGIFADDPDNPGKEILYALGNEDESEADYIPDSISRIFEMQFDVLVFVGSAENVTAAINSSLVYATKSDFDNHVNDKKNPHQVTKEQLGLDKVANVSTNDQTPTFEEAKKPENIESGENLSTIFGKIKCAIASLLTHLNAKDNPHSITAEKISAANKSHTHSTSDINSGTLLPQRGGTGVSNPEAGGLLKANGEKACESLTGVGALYAAKQGKPVFDTLPVSMGGTGVTTLADLSTKIADSLIICGVYKGDGSASREISLGFCPRAVLVFDQYGRTGDRLDTTNPYTRLACYGGLALKDHPISGVLSVTQNGFMAYYNDTTDQANHTNWSGIFTNQSGLSYYYVALR